MDQYDKAMANVIYKDSLQRQMVRKYGPTLQEEREKHEQMRREVIARDFEQGDHLPDGTVMVVTRVQVGDPLQSIRLRPEGLRMWLEEVWPVKPHE
jgi:hypothetical protein